MSSLSLISSSLAWHIWLVGIAWFACFGGVLVFIGLLMEKFFDAPGKKSTALKRFGEWMVIVGIGVEIVSAVTLAVRGEIEIKQLRIKEAQDDPLNRPLSDLSADVYVRVEGAPSDSPLYGSGVVAWMDFSGTNLHERIALSEFSVLESETNDLKSDFVEDAKSHERSKAYFLHFHKIKDAEMGLSAILAHPSAGVLLGRPAPKDVMTRVANITVSAKIIPHDSEIVEGAVTLLMNGSIPKYFIIPPQKAFPPPIGLGTNADNSGFTMFATNSLMPLATPFRVWPGK
jgi:hypothetical protein